MCLKLSVKRPHRCPVTIRGGELVELKKGCHALPGNIFLIGTTRLTKTRRKRLAMLKSCQNVPCMSFMQISAAITEKDVFGCILANNVYILGLTIMIKAFKSE